MILLAMLLFAFAGFVGICASMDKHQGELFGRRLERGDKQRVRLAGAAALAVAFACAVWAEGWKFGPVAWTGAIIAGAGAAALAATYRPRRAAPAGAGAAFVGAMLAASALLVGVG